MTILAMVIVGIIIGFSLGLWYCRRKLEEAMREGEKDAELLKEIQKRMKGGE